jgi:hypothetical protein
MTEERLNKFKISYRKNGRRRDELTAFIDRHPEYAQDLWKEVKYFLNNPAVKQRDGIKARESLAVTSGFIDQDSIEKDKPLFFEHCWKMYLETNDAAALADACLNAPFFGQSEMGPTIANLLLASQKNSKYAKALDKIYMDRLVREYADRYGNENAYFRLAEAKIFKVTQGKTKGQHKDAATLKREHFRWLADQKNTK